MAHYPTPMKRQDLALFDFDGTITTKDTLIDLLRSLKGPWSFWANIVLLTPYIALFLLKRIPNYRMKELFLTRFIGGMKEQTFARFAREYTQNILPNIVRPTVLERLRWHKKRGDRVIIVSASLSLWLRFFAEQEGVELIATEAEILDGIITGKLAGNNCYGAEKVNRIQEVTNLSDYNRVWAYGDSRGDTEMLAVADKPFFRTTHFEERS